MERRNEYTKINAETWDDWASGGGQQMPIFSLLGAH